MIALAVAGISLIGKALGGIFGVKKSKIKVVEEAVKVFQKVEMTEQERTKALALVLASEASSGYWLAACWRPLMMLVFLSMIVSYWFGYVPVGLQADVMPPMVAELWGMMKIGLGGYIVARSADKIGDRMALGKIVNGLGRK